MKVGCRYYDPQVGSFTTRDTYLDQKPYLYCEHDPVNGVDPSGHDWEWLTPGGLFMGVVGFFGFITGVHLVTQIDIMKIKSDSNYRRNRMIHDWHPKGVPNDYWMDLVVKNAQRDDISEVARTANAAGQTIYKSGTGSAAGGSGTDLLGRRLRVRLRLRAP